MFEKTRRVNAEASEQKLRDTLNQQMNENETIVMELKLLKQQSGGLNSQSRDNRKQLEEITDDSNRYIF